MTPAEILRAAKSLISDKAKWTTGAYAKTSAGRMIGVDCENACQFCAIGALARVSGTTPKFVEREFDVGAFLNKAAGERGYPHIVNDEDGHAAVMAMYDRAIELAEAASVPRHDRGTP